MRGFCVRGKLAPGVTLIVLLSLALCAPGDSNLPLTGDIRGVHDPAVIRVGNRYYLFSTGPGIPIYVSEDLRQWKRIGQVFREIPEWARKHVPDARDIWAPDISYYRGRYRLYYAVSRFGTNRSVIGLATSATLDPQDPTYRWRDEGPVVATEPERDNWNALDPHFTVSRDGTPYLVVGSYWSGIHLVRLNPATGKPATDPPERIPLAERRVARAVEAPFIVWRDGYYYLFVSHDFCCRGVFSTYRVVVGRSKSITGPYLDAQGRRMTDGGGTVVVEGDARWRGPGHNAVLQSGAQTYLVYHAYDAQADGVRTLRIAPLQWSRDGWPAVPAPPRTIPSTPVVGFWEHTAGEDATGMIRLLPDGTIQDRGGARWTLEGDRLVLRWPDPNAPGGAWVDRVRLDPDWLTYRGSNQNGVAIRGRRISDR
ncbi:MAG: arabinan endo-1,5-alpha-L-arabinosidase [Chloroherpetonaceae bacterium]|nr:arabinan endo-1,5-alpha-L-arabinosidase [Chthonomonadaceae bacterium]MDW8208708.1 arabinan endo-1,5-alpha-L-arabinosidase [Chloroherpetonaceae bacterium]